MNLLNLSKLSSDEILAGSFGIEWESLRAKGDGELSLTPHPEVFGDKLTNPLITTDFSESQIEIITPTFNTIEKAFDTFSLLSDLVNSSLPEDEYLWFQSIPCIIPYWDKIPIAQYSQEGEASQKYREDLAKKYTKIGNNIKDEKGLLHFGARDKKIKPLVNFVIAPFKFIYNGVTLPYRLVDKAVKSVLPKAKPQNMTPEEITQTINKKDIEALAKTIENIGKKAVEQGITPKEFQSYVKDNMLKAFNVTTMSNVSNAELSNLAKTAATASTLWFLMTDNYNMVMLKSNGNDVEGAETKFKERFVQEASRLFYQTLLIDLFNSTFRSQYNGSLGGMSWITLTNTTLGEMLTRKSVGMPITPHTRNELLEIERKQEEATGFVKGYYNFMRRLTGKRSINSYHVVKNNIQVEKPINFTHNRPVFADLELKKNNLQ